MDSLNARFLAAAFVLASTSAVFADPAFTFRDTGDEAGVHPHVAAIRGHGAAWGDLDGDGWPDLFVNTFHNQGSKPAMLLRNSKGKFTLDEQPHLRTTGLGSGALFVDLNNTGRLDLYASNCAHGKEGVTAVPSFLFRNDGGGKFTDISKESGACPPNFSGRGLAALDYDGDGLLDLILCERYYGPAKTGAMLLRNKGGYQFENVTEAAGIPANLGGLGVGVGDLNDDTWPDAVFTGGDGEHRIYMNDGKGKFRELAGARDTLRWKPPTAEDTPAGVCIGDVNRDGLQDIVIGQHYKMPWQKLVAVRLYINRGIKDGNATFEDITEAAGLTALAMKGPHVEIQDFDNDGWPDIYVSIVKFKGTTPHPVIFRNLGEKGATPKFKDGAWAVNDFPNADDLAVKGTGPFFAKLLKDNKIIYMAPGPSCDYDRDGRLDLFLPNWWVEDRSLLLRNETAGGNWLDVRAEGSAGVSRMGIGARVRVYPAGKLGDKAALLGDREIAIGFGFCSGQEAVAHFGLGTVEAVDIEVRFPHGQAVVMKKDIKANQRIRVMQRDVVVTEGGKE